MHGYKVRGPPVVGQPEIHSILAVCVQESAIVDSETQYRHRREKSFASLHARSIPTLPQSLVHEDVATARSHTQKQQAVLPSCLSQKSSSLNQLF